MHMVRFLLDTCFKDPVSFVSHSLSLQENVEGLNCDRCKLGFYNLQSDNIRGCEKCSCMGMSTQCAASTLTYQNVSFFLSGILALLFEVCVLCLEFIQVYFLIASVHFFLRHCDTAEKPRNFQVV